jgi:hypothetical protein
MRAGAALSGPAERIVLIAIKIIFVATTTSDGASFVHSVFHAALAAIERIGTL